MLSQATQMRLSFPYTAFCLSYHSHPIRPCGASSPRGEDAMREYHPLKRRHTALVNLSAPQVPSSRAQPRDLYCTAAICTHAPSLKRHLGASLYRLSLTHVLPVCKKDPSTSVGMTGGRRIASHSLSHRLVDPSCAFGADRLASQEGALKGPTRIVVMTGDP